MRARAASILLDLIDTRLPPPFADLSRHLHVEFPVRRLARARTCWLNEGWFSQHGLPLDDEATRASVEAACAEAWGFAAPQESDPPDTFEGAPFSAWADRYGAPSGSMHGGSGRTTTRGRFNVKGAGRTPLVSDGSDWYHTHGCMWLEEAIRETINATVADALFPLGAVPVVAVIDAGCRYRWRDGAVGARRALVVRPAFLRVASLMRSIYFGSSGRVGSDQWIDAGRVADLWTSCHDRREPGRTLFKAFEAQGEQYGFGSMLRLWPGPPFASNMTLDGRLVDFGSFRALRDWTRVQGEVSSHGFGREEALIRAAARTLERLAGSFGRPLRTDELVERFEEGRAKGVRDALHGHGVGVGSADHDVIIRTWRAQQARTAPLHGAGEPADELPCLPRYPTLEREALLVRTQTFVDRLPDDDAARAQEIRSFIEGRLAEVLS